MIYYLSPVITEQTQGQWAEGLAYERTQIYKKEDNKLPPVNYDAHTLKPHSLTHAESQKHISNTGKTIEQYFDQRSFFGKCIVIRLKDNHYELIDEEKGIYHWEVTTQQLVESIEDILGKEFNILDIPPKILLSTQFYPKDDGGFHDPNYVLTLSQDCANYINTISDFNLFGTSWKSSDYCPGSFERPIHKTLLKNAIILENLDLEKVPQGMYLYSGAPLRLSGASESPISPILVTLDDSNLL